MGGTRRINILFRNNGQGLTRDARMLARILAAAGHVVSLSPQSVRYPAELRFLPERMTGLLYDVRNAAVRWRRTRRGQRGWDVNLFLESINERYLHLAHANLFIPNQEWLTNRDHALMRSVDLVLFKTRHAQERLGDSARDSAFLGFTSDDKSRPGIHKKWDQLLHVAGWNPYKGTSSVIAAWRSRPDWPPLTVVAQNVAAGSCANIRVLSRRVPEEALVTMQNECGTHACVSEVEGFGHSINEARSCGAVVITTDGPPMNELITSECGLLVPYGKVQPMAYGTRLLVTEEGFVDAVERWRALSIEARMRLGSAARAAWERDDAAFRTRLLGIIGAT